MRHGFGSLGLLIATAALCLTAAPAPADPADPWAARPDASPFAIRELLRNGKTAELERRIAGWRARKDERRLDDAYWTFTHLPAAESAALDQWREASPGSATAQLAAAMREVGLAGEARGAGFASTISAQGRQEMNAHCARALALTEAAVRLDPERIEAYVLRIEIARLTGDRALGRESFGRGRAIDPTYFRLWFQQLGSSERRWGGSYEAVEQLAQEAQAYAGENPRLRGLLAWSVADLASDLCAAGRCTEALEAFDAALERGEIAWVHYTRGELLSAAGDYERALAAYDRAIEIGSPQPDAHAGRSYALFELERRDEGLAALELAVALEPEDAGRVDQLARTRTWLADQERWEEFKQSPNASGALEYGVRFLWGHAIESLLCTLALWVLWKIWHLLSGRRSSTRPSTIRLAGRAHPTLPSIVVLLLRSVLGVIVLHHVWQYGMGFSTAGPVTNGLDLPITAIALIGAIAYSCGWRLGTPQLWRIWAVLFPTWNVFYHFAFDGATLEQWTLWAFTHVELLPVYGSLFAYGYGAHAIWDEEPLVGSARAPA